MIKEYLTRQFKNYDTVAGQKYKKRNPVHITYDYGTQNHGGTLWYEKPKGQIESIYVKLDNINSDENEGTKRATLAFFAVDSTYVDNLFSASNVVENENMKIKYTPSSGNTRYSVTITSSVIPEESTYNEIFLYGSSESNDANITLDEDWIAAIYDTGNYYQKANYVFYTSEGTFFPLSIWNNNTTKIKQGAILYGISVRAFQETTVTLPLIFAPVNKYVKCKNQSFEKTTEKKNKSFFYDAKTGTVTSSIGEVRTLGTTSIENFKNIVTFEKLVVFPWNSTAAKFEYTIVLDNDAEKATIIYPDDLGAIGDGIAVDDAFFPEGNYIYYLPYGKTYKVTKAKVDKIHNNPVVGKGRIISKGGSTKGTKLPDSKGIRYKDSLYGSQSIFEMSANKPRNRFEECVMAYCDEDCWASNSWQLNTRTKGGEILPKKGLFGEYHNISAVHPTMDEAKRATLPDQFTICTGQSLIWLKDKQTGKWIKKLDEMGVKAGTNYRIPWGGVEGKNDVSRSFNHPLQRFEDGHCEQIIDKEEMISWLGTMAQEGAVEGCYHFWSNVVTCDFDNEYDGLVVAREIWVKEKEASGLLYTTCDADITERVHPNATAGSKYWIQPIGMPPMPITTERQMFWGTTMNLDEVRGTDLTQFEVDLRINEVIPRFVKHSATGGRNLNLFGVTESFETIGDGLKLSYDLEEDLFTLTRTKDSTGWNTLPIKNFDYSKLESGKTYYFNIQCISTDDSSNFGGYFGNIYGFLNDTDSLKMHFGNTENCVYDDMKRYTYKSFTFTPSKKMKPQIGTNGGNFTELKFRMWITEEPNMPYQKYGAEVESFILKSSVRDKYLENEIDEKLKTIQVQIDNIDSKLANIALPTADDGAILTPIDFTTWE